MPLSINTTSSLEPQKFLNEILALTAIKNNPNLLTSKPAVIETLKQNSPFNGYLDYQNPTTSYLQIITFWASLRKTDHGVSLHANEFVIPKLIFEQKPSIAFKKMAVFIILPSSNASTINILDYTSKLINSQVLYQATRGNKKSFTELNNILQNKTFMNELSASLDTAIDYNLNQLPIFKKAYQNNIAVVSQMIVLQNLIRLPNLHIISHLHEN